MPRSVALFTVTTAEPVDYSGRLTSV